MTGCKPGAIIMHRICLAAVVTIALIAGPVSAQDTIPNPEFNSWSKYKAGTRVTLKSTSDTAGMTSS